MRATFGSWTRYRVQEPSLAPPPITILVPALQQVLALMVAKQRPERDSAIIINDRDFMCPPGAIKSGTYVHVVTNLFVGISETNELVTTWKSGF